MTVSLTDGAGTVRVIEGEEIGIGLFKGNAVGLETVGEGNVVNQTGTATFEESTLHTFCDACALLVISVMHIDTVNYQLYVIAQFDVGSIFDFDDGAFHHDALVSFLVEDVDLGAQRTLFTVGQGGKNEHAGTFVERQDMVNHIADGVASDLHTRNGRVGASDAGE